MIMAMIIRLTMIMQEIKIIFRTTIARQQQCWLLKKTEMTNSSRPQRHLRHDSHSDAFQECLCDRNRNVFLTVPDTKSKRVANADEGIPGNLFLIDTNAATGMR